MLGNVTPEGWSRRDFLGRTGAAAGALAFGSAGLASVAGAVGQGVAGGSALVPGNVPPESQIFGWIRQVFEQGIRRPGYPADVWAEQFAVQKFDELGLENVHLEPITVDRWEPTSWSLDVIRSGAPTVRLKSFPVPFSPPVSNLEVELAGYNAALPSAVAGKASLYDELLLRIPANLLLLGGNPPPVPLNRFHDPDGSLLLPVTLPFGLDFQSVLEPSANAGAVAFVGALTGYPGDSYQYYVPYWGGTGPIPGVWISGSSGTWLRTQMLLGPVRIRLAVESTNVPFQSHNVVGELPGGPGGNDEDMVIVGSHHDGPWNSAVEDGSGISLVLAQASYWAKQPPEARPHRMVFLLHGGHMSGGAGLHGYIEAHRDELDRAVLELHLEHAAREFDVRLTGGVGPTGRPVPRWWFTSRIARLEQGVYQALVAEDLRRSMILAPDAFGTEPPTDGGFYHHEGVPIVNFLTAPFYLFDAMDTLDKIDRAGLVPLTRAAIRIIESTRGVTAAQMRSGG
ncbi:MAG: M28 family peptidase [Acidimicrobiales bacterium]